MMDGLDLILPSGYAPPYLMPFPLPGSTLTVAVVPDTIYWERLPRVAVPVLITDIEYWCATADGNVDLGLLTTDDPVGTQAEALAAVFDRVAHCGPVAAAGSGAWQRLPLTTPYQYNPNTDLWVSFGSSGAPTVSRLASSPQNLTIAQAIGVARTNGYSSGIPVSIQADAGSTIAITLRAILA